MSISVGFLNAHNAFSIVFEPIIQWSSSVVCFSNYNYNFLSSFFKSLFKSVSFAGNFVSNDILLFVFIDEHIENRRFGIYFPVSPFSKHRVLCLFYLLLRLSAWCYAVKYEEQICSQLSICSPRQILLHYDNNVKWAFKNWIWRGELEKEPIWNFFQRFVNSFCSNLMHCSQFDFSLKFFAVVMYLFLQNCFCRLFEIKVRNTLHFFLLFVFFFSISASQVLRASDNHLRG